MKYIPRIPHLKHLKVSDPHGEVSLDLLRMGVVQDLFLNSSQLQFVDIDMGFDRGIFRRWERASSVSTVIDQTSHGIFGERDCSLCTDIEPSYFVHDRP